MSAEKPYAEQFAYKSIEEYESLVGYKMNEAFKTGFMMGRITNGQLGITAPDPEPDGKPQTTKET